jgi:hypothetical protein
MPWWVAVVVAISAVCGGVPFLYARKLAREGGKVDGKPIWFGGIANLYLVTAILKEHSEKGNNWAGRARFMYCAGAAVIPALFIGLALHDWWFH